MPIYTVHEPPAKNGSAADPQRFAFVRDGFHFWAFLIGPVWMIYRRLWLALLGYLVLAALLEVAFYVLRAPEGSRIVIGLLFGVLIGLEASTLRRWTYARRKWKMIGVVSGDNQEEAERRFFADWVTQPARAEVVRDNPVPPMTPLRRRDPGAAGDIIGLFPQPERKS
jgi:hypothetical protein